METIGKQKLWSFFDRHGKAKETTCTAVRKSDAQRVSSYMELARKVAELQFLNRDFVLIFRGQSSHHRNKNGNTSLKPSIMRGNASNKVPTEKALSIRYETLRVAEKS